MKLLIQLHRSLFDISFYTEVVGFSWLKSAGYYCKLSIIAALCVAGIHAAKIFDRDTGLPQILSRLFSGMEITRDGMLSHRDGAYSADKFHVAQLFSVLANANVSYLQIPDSLMIVDENFTKGTVLAPTPRIIVARQAVFVGLRPDLVFEIPYSTVIAKHETIRFDATSLRKYLFGKGIFIYAGLLVRYLFRFLFVVVLSIFFLILAAYIFRGRQPVRFAEMIKIASFAVSPVILGSLLTIVSGTTIGGIWEVSLFVSLFIMVRVFLLLSATRSIKKVSGEER